MGLTLIEAQNHARRQISTATTSRGSRSCWWRRTPRAQGNALLGYDEPGDTTSIDCCVLGDAAVCGLQGPFEGRYGISVRDFGEVHDAWVFRTRVDWYMGFPPLSAKLSARSDPSTRGPNRRPCNRLMTPLCGKPSVSG